MCKKIFSLALLVGIIFAIMGCSEISEPLEFSPTFTHNYDGRQVGLGMHRDETGAILGFPIGVGNTVGDMLREGSLFISYDENDIVWSMILMASNIWSVAGISGGDYIQSVKDSLTFSEIDYNLESINDDPEFSVTMLSFYYDGYMYAFNYSDNTGIITMIGIFTEAAYLELVRL